MTWYRISARSLLPMALVWALVSCGVGESQRLTTQVDDWRDEVIYQVLVDRFDNAVEQNDDLDGIATVPGDLARYQGGDWRGIERRLDYIQRLGATAIWISPVVANVERTAQQDGFHGYWAADFTRHNRRFGSLADLQQLVRTAHQKGVKVLMDVVVNHTGRVFFYDLDGDGRAAPSEVEPVFSPKGPYEAPVRWLVDPPKVFRYEAPGQPPEVVSLNGSHFHRRGQTNNYLSDTQMWNGDFPTGLRDLNTEHDTVVQGMIDSCLRWVELTDVDGFRLDAVPHIPHGFWRRFAGELRQRLAERGKRNFLFVAEVYHDDPRRLAAYTREGGLDTVFDFPFKWQVIDGYVLDGRPAASAVSALEENRGFFPSLPQRDGIGLSAWQARVALADNHDLPRLRRELDDPFAAELAMTLVFTVDAIPSVYYGTEQELAGGWGDGSREPLWPVGFREHTRMFQHLRLLARLRREQVALRRGQLQVRYASALNARESGPGAGLLVFERALHDERTVVAVNAHPRDHARAKVSTGFEAGTVLRNLLVRPWERDRQPRSWLVGQQGQIQLDVSPRSALVLSPSGVTN